MARALTQTIQNQINTQNLKVSFILRVAGVNYGDSLVSWNISFSKEYGSATASFVLSNSENKFGENGTYAIYVGDTVEFIEKYGGDTTEFKKFYGIVNQRSISKAGNDRTITLECYDYIATLQYLDINLSMEGDKASVEYETLVPQYLPSPNESMAQVFNFANDSLADDPRPILVIRTKDATLEDPSFDGFEVRYETGQVKMGFPINALSNYDVIAKKYFYYTHGLFIEDILEEILTQPDGYGNYLFGETSVQDIIDNHLTENFYNIEGTNIDVLVPNYTSSRITIETKLHSNFYEGGTGIVVDDVSGLPTSITSGGVFDGEISINGDMFTYDDISSGNTLVGIPESGEYALKSHNAGSYVEYEYSYPIGQVWYLKYSNIITDLVAEDFDIPSPAEFYYFDKRNGRIVLDRPLGIGAIVRCISNYYFKTLQATGVEINQISFRDREIENRFDAIKKVRDYLAPNYIVRTLGDSKIWASYLYQKAISDYDLELISNLTYLDDQDLYTRVKFFGKNNNPTNLMFKDGVDFVTSGNPYKGVAVATELGYIGADDQYLLYDCPLSADIDVLNYCKDGTGASATGSGTYTVGSPGNVRDGDLTTSYGGSQNNFNPEFGTYNFSVEVTWTTPVYSNLVEAFLSFTTATSHTVTFYIDLYYNSKWNTEQTVTLTNPLGQQTRSFSGIWSLITGIRFRAVGSGTGTVTSSHDILDPSISCLVQDLRVWGSTSPTGIGKIIVETLTPTVWINNVPVDNKLHQMTYQPIIVETTTRTDTNTSAGGGKCLPSNTLVEMEDGTSKPISSIILGDRVRGGGKVLELTHTSHTEPIPLYLFNFGDKQVLASYYHPFDTEIIDVTKTSKSCITTYDINTEKGFYIVNGVKVLSILDKKYKPSEIYYNKNKFIQKLGKIFNKYFGCSHLKCSGSLTGCQAGGGGGGQTTTTTHTYYYYRIRFSHKSIEPTKEIMIYNSLGELIYTLPPNTSEMNYATGVLSVPGDVQRTDVENASRASYWTFYSSSMVVIDYDKAQFRISKTLIPDPLQAVVRATFEYLAVITPIKDIASIIDGKLDTQVQTEFYSQPPNGYVYGTIDLGSVKTIQALDILAGFFKPNRNENDARKFDIKMGLTLNYSIDGIDYHEVSDKTHAISLAGGESAKFEESDLGTNFQARYLRLLLENVGKIDFEKGVWVVAITEVSAFDDIVLTGEAKLIPYTTSTKNIVIEYGEDSNIYPRSIQVLSTEGFTAPQSGEELPTAYIDEDIFQYEDLTNVISYPVDQYTKLSSSFNGDDSDTLFFDSVNNNYATFNGTARLSTTVPGPFGEYDGCLYLDGNSDYITYPASTSWYFDVSDFTIDFFVNFSNISSFQYMISNYSDGNNMWYVGKDDTHKLKLRQRVGGVDKALYTMSNAWSGLTTSTWYHLAFVRYGTTALIFINGIAQTLTVTTEFGTNDTFGSSGNTMLAIGAYNSTNFVNGRMAYVRISKTALWTSNFDYPRSEGPAFLGVTGLEETHSAGARVSQTLEDESSLYDTKCLRPKLGDRLYKKMEIDDSKLYNQAYLNRLAKSWLREFVKNHSKATVNILYAPYLQVGQTIKLVDPFNNQDTRYFIESMQDNNGFYALTIAQYPET